MKDRNDFVSNSSSSSFIVITDSGAFDAPRDLLDYTVRVQFTKKDSLVGKILHPLAWPFTKLLLEFHLGGSPSNPEWHYISVIDRVVGGVE